MFHMSELPLAPITTYPPARNDDNDLSSLRNELPSYGNPGPSRSHGNTSRERQSHEFTLEGANKRPWVTVRFQSWAPSAKSLPVFLEDQDILGQVDLDLQQSESIKSVEVSIRGFVCAGHDEKDFLHISETLWNSSFGDPRSPNQQSRTKYTGKLKGVYSWPFSITLPHETPIEQKVARDLNLNHMERLPPSLHGQGWNSAINYRLTVAIKRHGVFRSDSSISTLIGYTPTTRPDPPSDARRRSYKEKTPIPGPVFDPNGWRVLQDIKVVGTLFKQREVAVTYTLALATPLSYTRGTVIPCHLTIRSSDKQALDLLASPSAPRITLRRKLTARVVLAPTERVDFAALQKGESQPLARAIWAPSERNEYKRSLMGELSVPLGCTPSFSFGEFNLEYFIDAHAPAPAGFQPASEHVLSSTLVRVVSAHAEGSPRPRAYITPAHDASRRVAQADALTESMGALALGRAASGSGASRPGSRPGTSSGLGASSPPGFDTLGQGQEALDASRSVSASLPTGSRRLSRRFSAF